MPKDDTVSDSAALEKVRLFHQTIRWSMIFTSFALYAVLDYYSPAGAGLLWVFPMAWTLLEVF